MAVGRQDGYDRFVVQVDAATLPPYEVSPQDSPVFVLDPRGDEVRLTGAFEGVVAYGLGVDGSSAVRVTTLTSPTRLVVDVLHP